MNNKLRKPWKAAVRAFHVLPVLSRHSSGRTESIHKHSSRQLKSRVKHTPTYPKQRESLHMQFVELLTINLMKEKENVKKKANDRETNTSFQALQGQWLCAITRHRIVCTFPLHVSPFTTQFFYRKAPHTSYTSAGPVRLSARQCFFNNIITITIRNNIRRAGHVVVAGEIQTAYIVRRKT